MSPELFRTAQEQTSQTVLESPRTATNHGTHHEYKPEEYTCIENQLYRSAYRAKGYGTALY